jgi:DNA-binding PadR family transcriptional regulator
MTDDPTSYLPLSPATLHILLALAAEDRHGYGIMLEVARQSEGQYKLGPGTLYDNLQKMMNQGMVESAPRRSSDDDPRRRYYRLTPAGRGILSAEIVRLESVVREARLHLRLQHPGGAV